MNEEIYDSTPIQPSDELIKVGGKMITKAVFLARVEKHRNFLDCRNVGHKDHKVSKVKAKDSQIHQHIFVDGVRGGAHAGMVLRPSKRNPKRYTNFPWGVEAVQNLIKGRQGWKDLLEGKSRHHPHVAIQPPASPNP